jgi:sarcosine oxidase, subunit gamma
MADTLTRRSPLQSWEPRFARLPKSASLVEEPFVTMVDLWVDAAGPGGAAAADVLGVDTLPATSSTAVPGRDTTVIWFGPREWLITSEGRAGEELEATLREAVSEHGGAAVDVSAQRTTLRLRGAHARDVIAKGCSLDLHPAVFGPGAAAQTMLGQAGVVLIPLSDNGTDYRIIVRSSFAGYLADWLIDAAEEFGVDW